MTAQGRSNDAALKVRRNRQGSENRRRQGRVSARVDPDERRRIEEAAGRAGMAVAEFIRHVVLTATVVSKGEDT